MWRSWILKHKTMPVNITPIPQIPKSIIDAVNNNNLAVFIGAGVSRLVGCIGWDQLAKNLAERCIKEELINYKEKETLLQNSDHKKTITICYRLFEKIDRKEVFFDEMKKALKEGESVDTPNVYNEIYRLRGLFVTTNADTHFDRLFVRKNIKYQVDNFDPDKIDRTNIYHIHGSIIEEDSLVFTVSQYFVRYNDAKFSTFLNKIFSDYVVLFMGYGMGEFELLDFIFGKYDSREKRKQKHFILLPFYRGEENILDFEQSYYNEMGIEVLPYEKDEKGYYQLYEVMKAWNKEINQVSSYLHDSLKEIEDIIEKYGK